MAYEKCLGIIRAAAGRDLSDTEMDELLTELQKRARAKQGMAADEAVTAAANDYAADMAAQAVIEKRNAAISLRTYLQGLDKVRSSFARNPALGIESILVGVNNAALGSRLSAMTHQAQLQQRYQIGLHSDLRRSGVLEVYNSGALDREISRALFAINRAEPLPTDVPREALDAAKVVSKWQEAARIDANRHGGWIKRLEGYITRQSHDVYSIRKAGYQAWRDFTLQKLDMARTLDGDRDVEEFMQAVYQGLASGIHIKTGDAKPGGFKGPANIAKKMSQERVLHFKNADAWFDYNERFGRGNLRESVDAQLSRMAQDTGLMMVLGPNPEANLKRMGDTLLAEIKDPEKKRRFSEKMQSVIQRRFDEVSGKSRIPVGEVMAQRSATLRAVLGMAKLGGAIASQFGDIAAFGAEIRYQGNGMLTGMGQSIAGMTKRVNTDERTEFLSMLGVYIDGLSASHNDRFSISEDGLPGMVSRGQQLFFKLNLMRFWSDRQKAAAVESFAHHLGMQGEREFSELRPEMQRVLGMYGIREQQWGVIRQAIARDDRGMAFAAPELIERLPDSAFAGMTGRPAVARREVSDQLRSYYVDRATYAQLSPDARVRSAMTMGTRPGTALGEAMRFIMQFKSFGVAMVQKSLGREIYGRGAAPDATLRQALMNGNGEILGVVNLLAMSALFGYGSMVVKDLMKGKSPRDPLSKATWLAALAQGGGMGIYGDYLFGEVNRFGGSALESAAGPAVGAAGDVYRIFQILRDQNTAHPARDAAAQTFRTALDNTPFINLFYTRPLLNYLFIWQAQEALSPGYLRRSEQRIKRETGQTFYYKPSEAIR